MKTNALILLMAASTLAATAQTAAKPAAPSAATAKPAATATKSATATTGTSLPPGIPKVRGIVKTAFTASLRYQDYVIGTGADALPNKLYKVQYTGYRAADGVKFDSSYDHPRPPVKDKDGKPVLGDDGKPKLGDPQPMPFAQGQGRTIPGFDMGFVGMKVGGKRRLFIPYQLAYGSREIPDHGLEHPGIPAKSDLIFDVELVDVSELPAPPQRGPMGGMPSGMPPHPGAPGSPMHPPTPSAPVAAPTSSAPVTPVAPATAPATSTSAKAPAPAAVPATAAPATPAAPQSK
jgi:peptidylprolyl isomerase